jgi:hypothetical protein
LTSDTTGTEATSVVVVDSVVDVGSAVVVGADDSDVEVSGAFDVVVELAGLSVVEVFSSG